MSCCESAEVSSESYSEAQLRPEVPEVDDQQGVVQPAAEDVVVVAVVVRVRAQLRVLRARHEHLREGVSEKYQFLMEIKGSFFAPLPKNGILYGHFNLVL